MTFSKEVKEELALINNWTNKNELKAELNGYLLSTNAVINENKIVFSTENISNSNRFNKILRNLKINYDSVKKGKLYITTSVNSEIDLSDIDVENKAILKCVLRGAFLASGTISNPNNKYHLDVLLSKKENAKYLNYITEQFGVKSKVLKRGINYSLYIKDGETISNFLALIGANKSVLNFEEIRVMREMKNNVNRIVNCETANLNKIINVSVSQIEDINYIIKKNRFGELPENLKQIAQIRLENPDMSLAQMGKLLENPIGKSGVNHRLKKISEIAEKIRREE